MAQNNTNAEITCSEAGKKKAAAEKMNVDSHNNISSSATENRGEIRTTSLAVTDIAPGGICSSDTQTPSQVQSQSTPAAANNNNNNVGRQFEIVLTTEAPVASITGDLMSSLIAEMTRRSVDMEGNIVPNIDGARHQQDQQQDNNITSPGEENSTNSGQEAAVPSPICASVAAETASSTTVSSSASKKKNRRRQPSFRPGQTSGRWTNEEHQAFLEGLKVCGREWKKVAERIPTRTSAQIRSHAQKYFAKVARDESMSKIMGSSKTNGSDTAIATQQIGQSAVPLNHRQQQQQQQQLAAASQNASEQPLPPSVQRTVQRILADPEGAQREVEETLHALRERYHELQMQLQTQRGVLRRGSSVHPFKNDTHEQRQLRRVQQQQYSEFGRHELRKISLEDATISARPQNQCRNDIDASRSNVDSTPSTSSNNAMAAASLASLSQSREFGDDELLAVRALLGGSLPRSSSHQGPSGTASQQQPQQQQGRAAEGETASVASAPSSSSSSSVDSDDSSNKKQRTTKD